MSRGGARQGAGRKSEWSSGKTTAIRVPEDLAPEIMMFARKLERERQLEAQQKHLIGLLQDIMRVSPDDRLNWIKKLSEDGKNILINVDCDHISVSARTYEFNKLSQEDGTTIQTLEAKKCIDIEAGIYTIEGVTRVFQLPNGYHIVLRYRNGKFEYLDGGSPKQKIEMVYDDNGEACLQISNIWNIHKLIE